MIFLFLSGLDIAYQVEFMADIVKRDGTDLTSRSQLRYGRGDSHFGNTSYITGQNGVHLVREISPWSSQVLCIGLVKT